MTNALKAKTVSESDEMAAIRFADVMVHALQDFIPIACRREAREALIEGALAEGFELTTKVMRKEYEKWKELTQLQGLDRGALG